MKAAVPAAMMEMMRTAVVWSRATLMPVPTRINRVQNDITTEPGTGRADAKRSQFSRQPATSQVAAVGGQERDRAQKGARLERESALVFEIGRGPVDEEVPADIDRDRNDHQNPEPSEADNLAQAGGPVRTGQLLNGQEGRDREGTEHGQGDPEPDGLLSITEGG